MFHINPVANNLRKIAKTQIIYYVEYVNKSTHVTTHVTNYHH